MESESSTPDIVAPRRQTRRIVSRSPIADDSATSSGHSSICITLKHEVAAATSSGEPPISVMCSGSVPIAMPSESICVKTPR